MSQAARGATVRLLILAGLLFPLGFLVASGGSELLVDVRRWVDSLGPWGPPVFALCYALAVTMLLPGSVLTASAGALFGFPLGAAAVLVGATAGAALSFGLARWLGRPAVARYTGAGRAGAPGRSSVAPWLRGRSGAASAAAVPLQRDQLRGRCGR